MRLIFLGIAVWDTMVAGINIHLLPHMLSADAMYCVTPTSQGLPVLLCLVMWAVVGQMDYSNLWHVFRLRRNT